MNTNSDKSPGVGQKVRDSEKLAFLVTSPKVVWNTLIILALALAFGLLLFWSREQPKIGVGQIVSQTRVARVAFDVTDKAGTESDRSLARSRAPTVYIGDEKAFEELRVSLENLPRALANVQSLAEVDRLLRDQFMLNDASLTAVQAQFDADKNAASREWQEKVAKLDASLRRLVIVDDKTYQRENLTLNKEAELRFASAAPSTQASSTAKPAPAVPITVSTANVVSLTDPKLTDLLVTRVTLAGFTGDLRACVASRIASNLKPTFVYDEALTKERAELAATLTPARTVKVARQQLIYAPGDEITQDKLDILRAEVPAWRSQGDLGSLWAATVALYGAGLLAALGLGAYVATYAPGIWRVPRRLLAVALLSVVTVGSACYVAAIEPRLIGAAMTAPVLFATIVLAVAFERRTALAVGSLLGILTCVALEEPAVMIGLSLCGVWLTVWRLREFRHRDTLVKAGFLTGLALLVTTILLEGLHKPLVGRAFVQTVYDGAFAGGGAVLVSFIVLGLLPFIERVFGVTTGMTLIELRDPRQPLLRELQQRAPGTYNHSLNVAALAEAAADAIGADSLLTYVGALYHDVGKMTKPEYFVENQVGGINRHDKLAPAMSLLVITGHVKEGIELAKEYALPKPLLHFIESHHGTTLVEFFYHRARKAAEGGRPGDMPQEIEYRYAGPRPRTKEAAILMICDASESATRTLPDPTPTRIDSLVRAIAHRRLMDGQFDNADLTLKEVATIVDAVSATLAAIHHQRIAYPEQGAMPIRQSATLSGVTSAASTTTSFPLTGEVTVPGGRTGEKRA